MGEQAVCMSFLDHAIEHGLIVEYVVPDGRWHRTPTVDHPRKKNGAYIWDSVSGAVKNWATMDGYATYRDGKSERIGQSEWKARQAISRASEAARQSEAKATAATMLNRAVIDIHPYLSTKGFPQERGLVLDGELLIPMRDFGLYKRLNSLQRISADGQKLFLPGGKAKGSVFLIGPFMARERWLVEGYATGLSVRAALHELHRDAQVVVCFSASNLTHVGRLVKPLSIPAFVMADNDKSGAGAKAAKETGLFWTMPMIEGYDANDWHREYGIRDVVGMIRDLTPRTAALRAG